MSVRATMDDDSFSSYSRSLTNPISNSSDSNPKLKPNNKTYFFSFCAIIVIIFLLLTPAAKPKLLKHPTVILISFDGFRFGYQHKTPTPNLHRLISNGTEAFPGLIPVFPSLTFPNHYSIATGLYPPHHGIVNNKFTDPDTSKTFDKSDHDPKWWLGEPIWETVANHGLPAAVYFWAGGEVQKGNWTCPDLFCPAYNKSVAFEDRVDAVLGYFDLPADEVPVFTAVYFSDPDSQGHVFGPDHVAITEAVAHLDDVLARLIEGLEKRGVFQEVHIVVVGDHGMAAVCDEKFVYLEDLKPWIDIPENWVQSKYQLLSIRPDKDNVNLEEAVLRMNKGLSSGKVENGQRLRVYLKEDLPKRLHYSDSDRVCPIIGIVEEGYTVEINRRKGLKCGGEHGYDNELFSMRSIFIGHGPRFEKGKKIDSFVNVEIYNLLVNILGLNGATNDGSDSFANDVLLPYT